MAVAQARRMFASTGSRVGALQEALADFTRLLGDRVTTWLPESGSFDRVGRYLLEFRDTWGVPREEIASIVSEPWPDWGLGTERTSAQGFRKLTCMGRRCFDIKEYVAARCLCCDAVDVDTRRAREAQVNQHHPLLRVISRTLERLGASHQVQGGSPLRAGRNLRMDIVTRSGYLLYHEHACHLASGVSEESWIGHHVTYERSAHYA